MKVAEKGSTKEAEKDNKQNREAVEEVVIGEKVDVITRFKDILKKTSRRVSSSINIRAFFGSKKIMLIGIVGMIFVLNLLVVTTGFAIVNSDNQGIAPGITINGVNVYGLSKEEAYLKISESLNEKLDRKIVIRTGEFEQIISPTQIEARYNIELAVAKAYEIGRNGNIFRNNLDIMGAVILNRDITVELVYNKEILREHLG